MQAWISKEQSQADDWQTYGKTDAGPRHTRHVTKGHTQQISKQQHASDYSVLVMMWRKGSSIFSDPSQKRWQWSCSKFLVNWCHSLAVRNNRSSASVSMASGISAANHFLLVCSPWRGWITGWWESQLFEEASMLISAPPPAVFQGSSRTATPAWAALYTRVGCSVSSW